MLGIVRTDERVVARAWLAHHGF